MKVRMFGLFAILLFATSCTQENKITSNEGNLVFVGRFDHQETESRCVYSASGVLMKFQAKDLSVQLTEYGSGGDQNTNFVLAVLDGDTLKTIQLRSGTHSYQLVDKLSKAKHVIQLYKQTETTVGEIGFSSFSSTSKIKVYPYDGMKRSILAIGDSWTAAYGNAEKQEAPPKGQPNTGFHSKNQNHYESWSGITSRALNANLECIAISGRGMYRNSWNSTDNTIPKVFDYYNPKKRSIKIDKDHFSPDVILIHLGTNDFIAEWSGEAATPLDSTSFVTSYIAFLEKIRIDYPSTNIVCLLGNSNSDAWPAELVQLSRFRNYVTSVVNIITSKGDEKVSLFELSPQIGPYGENWHPTIRTHHQMANEVTPYLKELMSW